MKIRLAVALVGLAISFSVPAFAQQKDTVDLRIIQQRDLLGIPDALAVFGELSGKLDDAYNNKDAEAAAALFTEDAVLVTPDGMVFGRQAIEKRYADTFQRWPITDFLSHAIALCSMQSTTLFGRSESGGELFKVRLVPYLHGATGQQFMFVRVTLGRCGC
jgi:Domain of unknown function (DUF4440)